MSCNSFPALCLIIAGIVVSSCVTTDTTTRTPKGKGDRQLAYERCLNEAKRAIPEDVLSEITDLNVQVTYKEVFAHFKCDYVNTLSTNDLVEAIEIHDGGTLSVNLDPHSGVYTPRDFALLRTRVNGHFGGLGIKVDMIHNEQAGLLVRGVIDDTPAARGGIMSGDVITKIDGKSETTKSVAAGISALRGPVDTNVTLTIWRKSAQRELTIPLTRAVIPLNSVQEKRLVVADTGVYGYIRIEFFSNQTQNDVEEAYRKLVNTSSAALLKGLVIDLRNNRGGTLVGANALINLFLDGPRFWENSRSVSEGSNVIISEEHQGVTSVTTRVGPTPDMTGGIPLLIVVNNESASASEIVGEALCASYRRALCAGSKTFGKGSTQIVSPLPTGGAVRVTTALYLIGPQGCERAVQRRGVTLDFKLPFKKEVHEFYETSLPNALKASTVSAGKCRYHYKIPAGHKEVALDMLRALDLLPKAEGATP